MCFVCSHTKSHCVAQASFKLAILLPPVLGWWMYVCPAEQNARQLQTITEENRGQMSLAKVKEANSESDNGSCEGE